MLLAVILMFGGLLAYAIVFAKTLFALRTDAPVSIIVWVELESAARYMPMFAYALATFASALWVEALARILDELKRRNATLMEP